MLSNNRITLRTLEPTDLDCLLKWENDADHWRVSNTFVPFSRKLMEEYIYSAQDLFATKQIRFIIEDNASKKQLGSIDLFDFDPFHLRAGVGVLIDKKYRNKGVGKDALELLKEYCFKHLNLNQIYCSIAASNEASIQLFEQGGFIQGGVKKQWLNQGGFWEDELFFQCLTKNH
ncbi:MAG: GNAT family N-acetyltransferase [Flavobacteriales bacterium]|jgi:diamine N-acetyltransferase|nr:GNAT family N-acetyltransferase [Flavobacteriales bacterium]